MKVVEVSAICHRYAITPDGKEVYFYWKEWKGGWSKVDVTHLGCDSLQFWNHAIPFYDKVHRGIFKIKVVED